MYKEITLEDIIQYALNNYSIADVIIRLILGVIIGFCLGLTGVGGGVLIIPLLQITFGMQAVMAVGTASIITSLIKISATLSHIRNNNVSWKIVFFTLIGAVPATIITSYFIVNLANDIAYKEITNDLVEIAVISIMFCALFSLLYQYKRNRISVTNPTVTVQPHQAKVVGIGVVCGSILGSTGIGGGVLLLPALNSILKMSIKRSVGSSIVIALVLSSISALFYSGGGQSDLLTAIIIVLGSFIGVPIAMKAMRLFSDQAIYLVTISVIAISLMIVFYI